MTKNIECFDLLTGRIFADLYQSFPIPTLLTVEVYCTFLMGADPDQPIDQMFETSADAHAFFDATCNWLILTGYIHSSAQFLNGNLSAVLTAKGFEALKSTPSVLTGNTLGSELVTAAKAGAMDQLKNLASQTLGAGVKLGVTLVTGAM